MNLLMELREGLGISWSAIRANKMRSILTTLGIIIGIVTVTLMGTAIEGLNRAFLKSISFMGADVLYVERRSWLVHTHEEWMRTQKRERITLAQARALERQMPSAQAMAPMAESGGPVKYGKRRSDRVSIVGTTEQLLQTGSLNLAQGRFLSPDEVAGGRPVCVIGSEVATNLFQREPPLGKRITIGQRGFEVVGVLERRGSFLGVVSLDNQAIIPIRQFTAEFNSYPDYQIQVKVGVMAQLEEAREELRQAMRRVRRLEPSEPDDFAINQQDQFVEIFNQVAGTIAAVGLFITGLSLFVGGIGIMNIMFVSVAERTREIGIRKAIGAKRRTILLQFLIEAASICLLGGLIALAIAWPLTLLMQKLLPATLSLNVAGLALLVALVTGVLAGFIPAWRAARMNPVDALRTGDA
jgi:putative ABC transport system permease protein